MGNLFKNKLILQLLEKYKTIWALYYFAALAAWDIETYMPTAGAKTRGISMGKISLLSKELFLDTNFVDMIKKASREKRLNNYEKAVLRVLKKELRDYEKLPSDFIEEFAKVTSEGQIVWRNAREKNDFRIFKPHMQKIFDLSKKRADYIGFKDNPYDVLLDEYEEGMTTAEIDKFFVSIKDFLLDLFGQIRSSTRYQDIHKLKDEPYDKAKMKRLNEKVLKFFKYPNDKLRIDLSTHPFTQSLSSHDVRITTRYSKTDFAASLTSTIHEFGHALYELQISDGLQMSPIGTGISLGIHESQSRFWENFVGRSWDFVEIFYKDFIGLSPNMKKYSPEDFYMYFNNINPGLIRVEADELTYHFHIMIRFEVEKSIMEGAISIEDAKDFWNAKYKEYLGIEPQNDSKGILQDVHWSHGGVGYFPTYSTGSVLSCIWRSEFEKEGSSIGSTLKKSGGIEQISWWLKEKIHKFGSTYTFDQLVKSITNKKFTPKEWKHYMRDKYSDIYGL